MTAFTVHTGTSAPAASRPLLEQVQKSLGFVPNLFGIFAESPAFLKGYLALSQAFDGGAFNATERQVILLATSYENSCPYCMAAHTAIAGLQKVPADVVAALRDGTVLADPRLEALRSFTQLLVSQRGVVDASDLQAFLAAGFDRKQALEVILGVGVKTLSNYVNHIAQTPLDEAFAAAAWECPAAEACARCAS